MSIERNQEVENVLHSMALEGNLKAIELWLKFKDCEPQKQTPKNYSTPMRDYIYSGLNQMREIWDDETDK